MPLLNDQSQDAPKLQVYLNMMNLEGLPASSTGPKADDPDLMDRLLGDGFEGVQLTTDAPFFGTSPLGFCGLDRINEPAEADSVFDKHKQRGDSCITLHLGWGMEDNATASRLVEAVLTASEKHNLPAFVETHRATITQDMWRTVQLIHNFPELLINGDFSHYYCGQEMVYGRFQEKMDFMAPIFDRVGFMHGRIASPSCMQMPIESLDSKPRMATGADDYLAHFRELWTRAMEGFLKAAGP